MQEAQFYLKLDDKSIECRLCSHFCLISNNNTGICSARLNLDGTLYSLVYGFPMAINIDPIEKKPLFHYFPGTLTLSLGTYGCNLGCLNCQNWDISQEKNIKNKVKNLKFIEPKKIVKMAAAHSCPSISYTYNEPTIFTEYALDIMKIARDKGLKNIWVTNGFMSNECLKSILPYLDAANIDLKSMDDNFYKKNCSAKIKPVLENILFLKKEKVHIEITTLVIHELSDEPEMLVKIANFISTELGDKTPWHISKFSPEISWQLKNIPPAKDDLIDTAYKIGQNAGLKYVYSGNIHTLEKENTFCPQCKQLAIERIGYEINRKDNHGSCAKCGQSLDITL